MFLAIELPIDNPLINKKPIIALNALKLLIHFSGPELGTWGTMCADTTTKDNRNLVSANMGQLIDPTPISLSRKVDVKEYILVS
ncbi:hypothetical protein GCM10027190_32640 [Spirosoma areae]